MKFKHISYHKIKEWLLAIAGILSMNPYFVWDTFLGGMFKYVVYIIYFLCIMFSCMSNLNSIFRMTRRNWIKSLLIFSVFIYTRIIRGGNFDITSLIGSMMMFVVINIFVLEKIEIQKKVFDKFIILFIISLIPGVIYYFFELLGISFSIGTLLSPNQNALISSHDYVSGGYYKLYIGAVMRVSGNTRFSGIYDEAGLVGTVCALILAARNFEFKKNKTNIILFIMGMLSFSFAFYVLIIFILIFKRLKKKQWKLIVILIGLIAGFCIIMSIDTENTLILNIQNRFEITQSGINFVNNRETTSYEKGFEEFINANISTRMVGFGRGAASSNYYINGSSTYKNLIFDYGIIGIVLMLVTIVYLYDYYGFRSSLVKWSSLTLIIVFVISMYQRPAIFYPFYFIVLYGGNAYLKIESANHYVVKGKSKRELLR